MMFGSSLLFGFSYYILVLLYNEYISNFISLLSAYFSYDCHIVYTMVAIHVAASSPYLST